MKDKYISNATSKLYLEKLRRAESKWKFCLWVEFGKNWLKKIFVLILTLLSVCSLTPFSLISQMPIKKSKIFCPLTINDTNHAINFIQNEHVHPVRDYCKFGEFQHLSKFGDNMCKFGYFQGKHSPENKTRISAPSFFIEYFQISLSNLHTKILWDLVHGVKRNHLFASLISKPVQNSIEKQQLLLF